MDNKSIRRKAISRKIENKKCDDVIRFGNPQKPTYQIGREKIKLLVRAIDTLEDEGIFEDLNGKLADSKVLLIQDAATTAHNVHA